MCAGACFNARLDRVVFGAKDEKSGAFSGQLNMQEKLLLNHKLRVFGGVLEQECSEILNNFFKEKR